MVLTRIITRNIQNHREVVFDLPPRGLIVFAGNNSNGKSVVFKATEALVKGTVSDPHTRADLVNKKSMAGEIFYERSDGMTLLGHIQREASGTYIELKRPDGTEVKRYLADKSYKALVTEFGWHYDEQTGISLQLAKNDEALLFYGTAPKLNGRVLSIALTDPNAEIAAENYTKTIKEITKYRDMYNTKTATLLQTLRGLKIEDTAPLKEKLEKLNRCFRNLNVVYFPTIPEIHAVPDVKLCNLYEPRVPKIRYPRIYEVSLNIPDITQIARDLKSIEDMKCPTCGRRFDEHDCENLVHS